MSYGNRYYDREAVKEAICDAIKWGRETHWKSDPTPSPTPADYAEDYLRDNPGNVWDRVGFSPKAVQEAEEFIPEEVEHIFTEYVVKIASSAVEAAFQRIKEES